MVFVLFVVYALFAFMHALCFHWNVYVLFLLSVYTHLELHMHWGLILCGQQTKEKNTTRHFCRRGIYFPLTLLLISQLDFFASVYEHLHNKIVHFLSCYGNLLRLCALHFISFHCCFVVSWTTVSEFCCLSFSYPHTFSVLFFDFVMHSDLLQHRWFVCRGQQAQETNWRIKLSLRGIQCFMRLLIIYVCWN